MIELLEREPVTETRPEEELLPRVYLFGKLPEGCPEEDCYTSHGNGD